MVENGITLKLEILRMMAEIACHAKQIEPAQSKVCLEQVFKHLLVSI